MVSQHHHHDNYYYYDYSDKIRCKLHKRRDWREIGSYYETKTVRNMKKSEKLFNLSPNKSYLANKFVIIFICLLIFCFIIILFFFCVCSSCHHHYYCYFQYLLINKKKIFLTVKSIKRVTQKFKFSFNLHKMTKLNVILRTFTILDKICVLQSLR